MRSPPWPELVAPLPLAAAGVVLVNDAVLKRRFPGAVTGKLSDLAGAFVLPLFFSAVLAVATPWPLRRRLVAGVALAVIALVAVKVSPAAARAVAGVVDVIRKPLTGGRARIAVDPTDLVALPFALAAYPYGLRRGQRVSAGERAP